MENAIHVGLDKLLAATTQTVDQLLQNLPSGASQGRYCGDMSDTVTGFRGVSVFVYTDGDGTKNLQVNGPEPLLQRLENHYPYPAWGRADQHLVFDINNIH